jgi:hypothetical protein
MILRSLLSCIGILLLLAPFSAQAASPVIPALEWVCYPDGSPDPCHNDLLAVAQLSLQNAWAVGAHGTTLHWNGLQWTKFASPSRSTLRDVWMLSDGRVWCVGDGGTILLFSGGKWSVVDAGVSADLNTIAMSEINGVVTGWIAGDGGTLLKWNGSQWVKNSSPTTHDLYSLAATLSGLFWMGGEDGLYLNITGDWETSVTYPAGPIRSITNDGSQIIWVVQENASTSTIYRFNWQDWTTFGPFDPLTTAMKNSNGKGWGLKKDKPGEAVSWNGSDWVNDTLPGEVGLNDMAFGSAYGWMVGDGGLILYYNDISWAVDVPLGTEWSDTAVAGPQDAWLVGAGGKLRHWNGLNWADEAGIPAVDLKRIQMLTTEEGWAIGKGGTILHYSGAGAPTWQSVDGITKMDLADLSMIAADNGYIVGDGDLILHWNGNNWEPVSSGFSAPDEVHFRAITCASAEACWISYRSVISPPNPTVGYFVAPWHPGNGWGSAEALDMASLAAVSDQEAYGAGAGLFHFTGGGWALLSSGSGMRRVQVFADGTVWADNVQGRYYEFDGHQWQLYQTPTSNDLRAAAFGSGGTSWMVGAQGALLEKIQLKVFLPLIKR